MCHVLFMHLSIYIISTFLVTVNNAAMNISLQIFVAIGFSPRYIPKSGIAGSHGNSMFIFLRNCQTFLKRLQHFTFPPAVYENSNFSTPSPTFVIICLFSYSHLSGCQVASHCVFDFYFSDG